MAKLICRGEGKIGYNLANNDGTKVIYWFDQPVELGENERSELKYEEALELERVNHKRYQELSFKREEIITSSLMQKYGVVAQERVGCHLQCSLQEAEDIPRNPAQRNMVPWYVVFAPLFPYEVMLGD